MKQLSRGGTVSHVEVIFSLDLNDHLGATYLTLKCWVFYPTSFNKAERDWCPIQPTGSREHECPANPKITAAGYAE